jgi:hypothetical protein
MLDDGIGEPTEDSAIDPPETGSGGGNAATGTSMALETPAGEQAALSDPPESGGGGGSTGL